MDLFQQTPPELGNQYGDDAALQECLNRLLPQEMIAAVAPEMVAMGELSGGVLRQMQLADRLNEPVLTQWDGWGRRIDQIELTPLWRYAQELAAQYGLVAAGYESHYGEYARLRQFALVYLFAAASDVYSCPLAMTDGTARALLSSANQALIDYAVPHLTSRDPATFWTSGQWMTEMAGGSDVGRTETRAWREIGGQWRLEGRKWFTSAVTSQVALTLARPEGNGPGGRGLALFFVELRDSDGCLQNIEVLRLKDKLGTRKVPTAELMLRGTPAQLVGEPAHGVRQIAPMLNITRTWNAVTALAYMRRGIALARDYARRREAFGAALIDKPLHVDTLAGMQAELEAGLQLVFFVVRLLGRQEHGATDAEQGALLRLLIPISKLMTGKQAVAVTSEALEAFGGAGYVEDTGLPVLLRDAQVLSIWEGTTNVLSLEGLKALQGAGGLSSLKATLARCGKRVKDADLAKCATAAAVAVGQAETWLAESAARGTDCMEAGARRLALTLGRATALALLAQHAQWALDRCGNVRARTAAKRFMAHGINLLHDDALGSDTDRLAQGHP